MADCLAEESIGKSNGLFHRPQHGVSPHAPASGWPALSAAGRPQARAAGHGQDGWLVTGSLRSWDCSGGLL